jgi:peptidoglycan/LPS O-acetylase OafA/YrhL
MNNVELLEGRNIDYGRFAFCLQFDQNVGMMLIFNASLATDTFLLLSGTLLAYGFMRLWDNELSFNIASFYIHRYLR